MKKLSIIVALFGSAVLVVSCGGTKREPSRAYMPDMAYSRAYETYADHSWLKDSGVFYNNMPVPGTIARGQELPFHIPKDKIGDSVNYVASKAVTNPLTTLSAADSTEAERLYLIQCAICHGTALDGNGPLFASGKFTSKPATLVGDAKYEAMPEGQMFYSVTYGKNAMGPYGAQLNTKQRWMVIHYIKSQQAKKKAGAGAAGAGNATGTGTMNTGAGKDTTAAAAK